jgi:hypothetical protein
LYKLTRISLFGGGCGGGGCGCGGGGGGGGAAGLVTSDTTLGIFS